jgi:hypothetical protein
MVIGPEIGVGMKKEVNDYGGLGKGTRQPRRASRIVDRHNFTGYPAALSFQILTGKYGGDYTVEAGKV